MITASATFDTTLQGVDTEVTGTLLVDLPTGTFDFSQATAKVSMNGQMSTPLPDGIRDAAGYSTIGGDITLAGVTDPDDETATIIDYFNPDNTASPLYQKDINGSSVTFSCVLAIPGAGTESVTRFTGWVNGADIDHGSGEVTLHVVDQDPSWATSLDLPGVITDPPWNAGLTSEFAMDAIIRRMTGGASSWPAQRQDCVLAVGLRSSIWPEVGTLDPTSSQPVSSFSPCSGGGTGLNRATASATGFNSISWTPAGTIAEAGTSFFVEFWLDGITDAFTVGLPMPLAVSPKQIIVTVSPTGIVLTGALLVTWSTTVDAGTHYVAAALTVNAAGTSMSGTLYLDAATQAVPATAIVTGGFAGPSDVDVVTPTGTGPGAIFGLQVTTETSPTPNNTFVPAAVLDPSLNPLTVVPAIDQGTAPWDELQTVAAAELGYIRRDEATGQIVFTNRTNLLSQAVAREITSDESLLTIATSIPAAATYRTVQVPYTEWEFGSAGLIWSATTRKKIPAWGNLTWTQSIGDGLAADLTGTATVLADGGTTTDGGSYYRAARDKFGIANHPGALTVTITQLTGNTVQIAVDNPWPHDAWLVTPGDTYTDFAAGTPALWVGGMPVTPADEATVTVTYSDAAGTYQVPSNPYLQDHDTAQVVGQFLINQLAWTIRDYGSVTIRPDPRIQTGDLDHLIDAKTSGIDEYVLIWGWSLTAEFPPAGSDSAGTWDMSLDPRALAPPGAWLIGIPGRTELGTTTYVYA